MIDAPSDAFLIIGFVVGLIFSAVFAFGKPRLWYKDPLGWVIFLYSISVDALLFLIVYGIVFGQKVDEIYRLAISFSVAAMIVSKIVIVIVERRRFRKELEHPSRERFTQGS